MAASNSPTSPRGVFDLEKHSDAIDQREASPKAWKRDPRGLGLEDEEEAAASCSDGEVDGDDGDDEEGEEEGADDDGPTFMDRVLSRVTSKSSIDPGPPPDGGWQAWGACLAGHLVITNTWGWINSFGTFQTYYTDLLARPSSDISWIGSITVFLLFFIGTLTGRLVDAGYFRALFFLGSALQVAGLFATSFCTRYWQFLVAQGLVMGLANGAMFCPVLAVLSTYFHKKKALAVGIAACGSATGGLVFPSMVRQLLPQVGFAWTIRAIGFIQLATLAIAQLVIKPRVKPRKSGALVDLAAFKELEYTFYAAGSFFCFWGVYFAFYYLAAFSREVLDPPLSYTSSLSLLLLLNGIGVIGRLGPNYIADQVGAINVFIPVSLSASIIVFAWIAVGDRAGLYAWSIFYGIFAAGIQSLFPAGIGFLTTDLRKAGVRMGMIFTIVSFAVLTGPPIAGIIIDRTGSYIGAQAFSGSCLAIGCGFLFAAKVAKMRKTGAGWMGRV